MTKTIWTGMCAAIVSLAATAALTAQTAASPQSNAANAERKITVTGCLQPAPPSSTDAGAAGPAETAGTAGVAGAAGRGDTAATLNFILTNATTSSADTAGAASPAGAPSPGAAAASGIQKYRLIANPSALSPHVGKKVELTGTLDESDSSSRTKPPEPSDANALTLKVESGKIVAPSCSQ